RPPAHIRKGQEALLSLQPIRTVPLLFVLPTLPSWTRRRLPLPVRLLRLLNARGRAGLQPPIAQARGTTVVSLRRIAPRQDRPSRSGQQASRAALRMAPGTPTLATPA